MNYNFTDSFFNCQKAFVTRFTRIKLLVKSFCWEFPESASHTICAIFVFAPKIDNAADVILHCILRYCLPICYMPEPLGEFMFREKLVC